MSQIDPLPEISPPQQAPKAPDPGLTELNAWLDRWLRWYRLRRAVTWMVHGLAAGLVIGLMIAWLLLWRSSILRPEFFQLVTGFALVGLLLGASVGYGWPLARLRAARFFDRQFDLKERISTALELDAGRGENLDGSKSFYPLRNEQLNDALKFAQKVDLQGKLPIRIPKVEAALVLILGIFAFASLPLAAERFEAASQQRSVQAAIETSTAQMEALIEKIQADPKLNDSQKDALIQPLQTAAQRLHQAKTLEESVSALTEAQGELQALADPQADLLAQRLQQVGQGLSKEAGSPLEQTGQLLAEKKLDEAAKSLAGIDPARLTPAQQGELARQLQDLSNKLQETDPSLSQKLSQAADQLQAGQASKAKQAMQGAAISLAAAGEKLAQSDRAGQAAARVEEGRQQLLQSAGIPAGTMADQGSPAASEGTGTSSQTGQGSGASGAGRGESQGETTSGQEAGVSPIGQSNGPGDGGLRPSDQVYAPRRLGGEGGPAVTLPEDEQPGDLITGSSPLPLGQPGQSQVPYQQVYQAYAQAYRQAIEHGQVPPALRDVVRDYFSSLEP